MAISLCNCSWSNETKHVFFRRLHTLDGMNIEGLEAARSTYNRTLLLLKG